MRINQVLAQEQNVKKDANHLRDALYKVIQKPALFDGHSKVWEKLNEDYPDFPNDDAVVQYKMPEILRDLKNALSPWYDIEATKNAGNCTATADIVVNGQVLLPAVNATTILFLEKELSHLRTILSKAPELSRSDSWHEDPQQEMFRSEPKRTHRTMKVIEPLVLFPATDRHPAQTDKIQKDVIIGHWVTVKHSGALSPRMKRNLIERVDTLLRAVRDARARANLEEVQPVEIANAIFQFLGWDL